MKEKSTIHDIYTWESKVRDYEIDSQGIVNNSIYVNYFEQCRTDYVRSLGVDLHEFYQAGYIFVVAAIEIQYLKSLVALDEFYVTAEIASIDEKRTHFKQEIRRKKDNKLVTKAMVHIACVDLRTRKAAMPDKLKHLLFQDKDREF